MLKQILCIISIFSLNSFALDIDKTSVDLGDLQLGVPFSQKKLTSFVIHNDGNKEVENLSVSIVEALNSDQDKAYSIIRNTCGGFLPIGEKCSMLIKAQPALEGDIANPSYISPEGLLTVNYKISGDEFSVREERINFPSYDEQNFATPWASCEAGETLVTCKDPNYGDMGSPKGIAYSGNSCRLEHNSGQGCSGSTCEGQAVTIVCKESSALTDINISLSSNISNLVDTQRKYPLTITRDENEDQKYRVELEDSSLGEVEIICPAKTGDTTGESYCQSLGEKYVAKDCTNKEVFSELEKKDCGVVVQFSPKEDNKLFELKLSHDMNGKYPSNCKEAVAFNRPENNGLYKIEKVNGDIVHESCDTMGDRVLTQGIQVGTEFDVNGGSQHYLINNNTGLGCSGSGDHAVATLNGIFYGAFETTAKFSFEWGWTGLDIAGLNHFDASGVYDRQPPTAGFKFYTNRANAGAFLWSAQTGETRLRGGLSHGVPAKFGRDLSGHLYIEYEGSRLYTSPNPVTEPLRVSVNSQCNNHDYGGNGTNEIWDISTVEKYDPVYKLAKSCKEAKERDPSLISNLLTIDFDGWMTGEGEKQVYCDMSSTGVTKPSACPINISSVNNTHINWTIEEQGDKSCKFIPQTPSYSYAGNAGALDDHEFCQIMMADNQARIIDRPSVHVTGGQECKCSNNCDTKNATWTCNTQNTNAETHITCDLSGYDE